MFASKAAPKFAGANPADRGRFGAAARHSRRVRRVRVALPVIVALALLSIVFAAYFNPLRVLAGFPVDISKIAISGSKVTMEAPRMSGFTSEGRAYDVSAQSAVQDLSTPTLLELNQVNARFDAGNDSTATVTAPRGFFDTKAEILRFGEELWIGTTDGYEARLTEAVVDIRKGTLVSEKPVAVKLPNGTIDGNRIEVSEGGNVVRFGNGVSVHLNMSQSSATAQAGTKAP